MVVYSNGMRYQTSGKHAWWTTTWERAEKRRQKAGGTYKAVPGVKFNGGSLAVGKDKKGNVHVFSNNRESYKVTELGPRGMRKATDWSYLSLADQKKASKMISSIFAGVNKGKYKLGSTGSKGG